MAEITPTGPVKANASSIREDLQSLHGLLFVGLCLVAAQLNTLQVWPYLWLAPLLAYLAIGCSVPALRKTLPGLSVGRGGVRLISAALGIGVLSIVILVTFHSLARPDIGNYEGFLPLLKMQSFPLALVLFSFGNALLEELSFRWVLYGAVQARLGDAGAVLVSGALFGFCHLNGYPSGITGALLAGLFGVALGWLRYASRGLGMPVLAHVMADAAIFCLVNGSLAER